MGIARVAPGNLKLLALLEAGATFEEFAAYVPHALQANDPFSYLLATVENERKRAAQTVAQMHHGAMPTPTKPPTAAELRVLEACPSIASPHLRQQTATQPITIDAEEGHVAPQLLG